MTKSCVPWICFLKWQFINSTITHMWETSSHPWHLNTVQVFWHLPPPSIFSLFEMTGKKPTNHRFNGFNKFTPSVPICSTQYSFETPDRPSSGQQSRSDLQSLKVQVLWAFLVAVALVWNWYLPIFGRSLNVPVKKAFSPARGSRKVIPQTQWRSGWGLSSVPCLQACVFVFCFLFFFSGARDQNLTWVTRNKTVMAIKGVTRSSGASCPSHIQYMCFTEKQKNRAGFSPNMSIIECKWSKYTS